MKIKNVKVGVRVVAEGSNVGVPVGTVGTVTIAGGAIMPKVQYEGGSGYWTNINQLGLVNE